VFLSVHELGKTFGVPDVNPGWILSNVAHHLIFIGVPMNVIGKFRKNDPK
jgi:hypothetical protein